MATFGPNNLTGGVVAGNGLGPRTFIFAITTATISVANAVALAHNSYNMTVTGVTGTAGGTEYIACQGGNTNGSQGLEGESGVALTATFE